MSIAQTVQTMRDAFNMTRQRCNNPNNRDYKYYGGRGIKICPRWLESFDNFVADMGLRPEGMTLERKDVNADYSPENCEWVSRKTQMRNTVRGLKLTLNGETKSLADWADLTGIPYSTLKARKQRLGYSDADCLTKSVESGVRISNKVYAPRPKPVMPDTSGFKSWNNKFNLQQVREMQTLYDAGGQTYSSIARLYDTSVTTASNICQRKKHYA